ncbi:Protein kinase domain [Macleaya cordata]|uniref:Protein kinase domain n=1 Tax=Macleaya cordata TaxID=56857 RepID=A0A200PYT5_MACCD|nr:Protein kinase domain [Macleaya cordata]
MELKFMIFTSSLLSSSVPFSLSTFFSFSFFFVFLFLSSSSSNAQQTYLNNEQLDCYNNISFTNGYYCNGPQRSCISYLTFRSQPPYDSAKTIARLLRSKPSKIVKINNLTNVVQKIPFDTLIIVPMSCSCSGSYYQHNTSYVLKNDDENYFTMANNTYQGLTTCQSLISQNPDHDSLNLFVGLNLSVPLRCACPSRNQTAAGFKFLLTYLPAWEDDINSISVKVSGGGGSGGAVNPQSVLDANELSEDTTIYPFTPILVPLKTEPKLIKSTAIPPPPPDQSSADLPPVLLDQPKANNKSSKKWVSTGTGIGIGSGLLFLLALSGFVVWFLRCHRRRQSQRGEKNKQIPDVKKVEDDGGSAAANNEYKWSVSSEGVRCAMDSLISYKLEELQNATMFFREANRIKGSVYRGVINGDTAAIKRMKLDISDEINILKQINHSNVIRLSGFCMHEGNTFLVYEFAENGSLSDWLHHHHHGKKKKNQSCLGWKQRVHIAYQVADGLNYLHNYANPPYIHKDLKSSNILLDSYLRAKIANFGVARCVVADNLQEEEEGGGGDLQLQSTRHVVGTKGYMPPEYLVNGVITPKMDVFAFGVVILELLSGREAVTASASSEDGQTGSDVLLSESIKMVLDGENVREKLKDFIDPSLKQEYPLDLVFSMAQLAMDCVALDLNSRPTMLKVFMSMSKILSYSLEWEPSV